MFTIIGLLVFGLIVGALARLLVPGRDPMGCIGTALLGVVGSYVGGAIGSLIFNGEIDLRQANSFIGALVGAVILLIVLRMVSGRR
jgi:uncharacterized membrane protein YeaQ/YmgE (transglycosylase-associated protein family)